MARELIDDWDDIHAYGADYVHLCMRLKRLTGIDLSSYKSRQMHRRLQNYRSRQGFPDFYTLSIAIQRDGRQLDALVDFLTINVSEFFRNPEHWKVLSSRYSRADRAPQRPKSPYLERRVIGGRLTPGHCRAGGRGTPEILGTDDELSLEKARPGSILPMKSREEQGVPRGTLSGATKRYRVRVVLRWAVSFRRGNLLVDGISDLDPTVCRNVLVTSQSRENSGS